VNKPSSISKDVTEIRINSQPCKGNNLTTWHTRATRANEWPPFAMTIKELGRVLPCSSVIFHVKGSWVCRWWPDTIPSEQSYNEVSYHPAQWPSSYLVSGGISARMHQYTTQTLVRRGSTNAVLNRHRWGLPFLVLRIYEPSHSHPSHPVFSTFL
jgi:hypothetical protein